MTTLHSETDAPRVSEVNPIVNDLACLVSIRLRRSGYAPLWCVKCEAQDDVVSLSGMVPSFYLKQIAQELAGHTVGVRRVENRLRVAPSRKSRVVPSLLQKNDVT